MITAERLLDVRNGHVLSGQAVLVEGDLIREIGPAAGVRAHAAKSARMIELGDVTLLPGLIDAHTHYLGNPDDLAQLAEFRMSPGMLTIWGVHNVQSWMQHGFTTLRNACESDETYGQIAIRDAIRQGLIKGPRIVSAGECISATGGHGDADVLGPANRMAPRTNIADTPEEIATAVRTDIKYGADWIKLMVTGGVGDPISDFNVVELSDEQLARAVEVAHRSHKKVMVHAEGVEGIKAAARAGVDSIEHGTQLDEEGATLMAKKGIWLVPTIHTFQRVLEIGTNQGQEQIVVDKTKALIKSQGPAFERALRHGVKIAYGTDDGPEISTKEFLALVGAGMKPLQAIQAATIGGSEMLGMSSVVGTLEAGKFADIVAVPGDPTVDIGQIEKAVFVMKGGEVMKSPR